MAAATRTGPEQPGSPRKVQYTVWWSDLIGPYVLNDQYRVLQPLLDMEPEQDFKQRLRGSCAAMMSRPPRTWAQLLAGS